MVTQVSGVDVLLGAGADGRGRAGVAGSSPLIEYARHVYDVIIIDTGGVYGNWNLNPRGRPMSCSW